MVVSGGQTGVLDQRIVEWIRKVHPTTTWTTSVCTGAIYLAAAGVLEGLDATTHWAWAHRLDELGAHYVHDRLVQRGKIITAAGVSSGIDMGLTLQDRICGPTAAQSVQLAIEYDPQPLRHGLADEGPGRDRRVRPVDTGARVGVGEGRGREVSLTLPAQRETHVSRTSVLCRGTPIEASVAGRFARTPPSPDKAVAIPRSGGQLWRNVLP